MTKLFKLDLTISVFIDLFDNTTNNFVRKICCAAQNLSDFVRWNSSTVIFIKNLEGWNKFLFWNVFLFIHCRHDELRIINESWVININGWEQFFELVFIQNSVEMLFVSVKNFLPWEFTVSIFIHRFEDFGESLLFWLWNELRSNVGVCGLL